MADHQNDLQITKTFASSGLPLGLMAFSVRKDEIPSHLRSTDFYQSLSDDKDDQEMKLSKEHIKQDLVVDSPASLRNLLSTLRFWGSDDIPEQLIGYCCRAANRINVSVIKEILTEYESQLRYLPVLIQIMNNPRNIENLISAASEGYIQILRYLLRDDSSVPNSGRGNTVRDIYKVSRNDYRICSAAVRYGHLDCLRLAHEEGCGMDPINSCTLAAWHGHLNCLEYAHKNGCEWDVDTCRAAADGGHLECLIYAHENGCPWDELTTTAAVTKGHFECLKYAHEKQCKWMQFVCKIAAENGHLDCLIYAHEEGCPWSYGTAACAAKGGHLKCLRYVFQNGCGWSDDAAGYAAEHGHLSCLAFMHEKRLPLGQVGLCERCGERAYRLSGIRPRARMSLGPYHLPCCGGRWSYAVLQIRPRARLPDVPPARGHGAVCAHCSCGAPELPAVRP